MIAVGNHLWQSTMFAVAAWMLTLCLRGNRAEVRHRIWLAASLKFLVPFSLLLAIGTRIEWQAAAGVTPQLTAAAEQMTQPFTTATEEIPPVRSAPSRIVIPLLFAAWLCGFSFVAARWWFRCRHVRRALRSASAWPGAGPVKVLSTPGDLEPGVFGVFRPVLVLPAGIESHLSAAQLGTILAHEFCHVRRRDNFFAALHMVVEAIFWFHPLVWFIGGMLVEERELACDEEVLQSGADPESYAAGILSVCKLYLESPVACAAGVTGADLKRRVRAIMTRPRLQGLTAARKLVLAAAAVVAFAGPVVVGVFSKAQAQTVRFEVASIKKSRGGGFRYGLTILPGGGLKMDGVSLKGMIAFAYDVTEDKISGGPKWMGSETYDVVAKAEKLDTEVSGQEVLNAAPGTPVWNRVRLRTQELLKERFHLQLHENSRESSGYELVLANGGPKLELAKSKNPPSTMRGRGRIDGRNGSVGMLAVVLGNYLGRPVADHTGLKDTYDYVLTFGQDARPDESESAVEGPTIEMALEQQLGLKLRKSSVEFRTIVVDGAQRASEN